MKKNFFIYFICLMLFVASCGKKEEKTDETKAEEKTEAKEEPTKEETSTPAMGKVNEPVRAGEIEHTIVMVEKLDKIPAANTIEQFKSIAKDMPAEDGMVWMHLKGKITNKSKKASSANITSIVLMDKDNKEFKASTKVVKYVESGKMLTSIQVQPDQTIEWEAYYSIPKAAEGLKARVTDLTFSMKDVAMVQL